MLRQGEHSFTRPVELNSSKTSATILGLRTGRYDQLRLFISNWPTVVLDNVIIGPGSNQLGRVHVERGSRLRLRIIVPKGQGAPRLTVTAQSLEDSREIRLGQPVEYDVVTVPGLARGRWKVIVRVMPAIRERFSIEREIELDGETDVELEVDLRR